MSGGDGYETGDPVPARWSPFPNAPDEARPEAALTEVVRDGSRWPLGTAADVEWITSRTTVGLTISSGIPLVFEAYATIVLPTEADDQERHDEAVLSILRQHSTAESWWLGYLDTGADDIVFPEAPKVSLYSGWSYVLVLAGPEQAATWRSWRLGSFRWGHLPNLMFPTDRRWLVSTLWDDDWTCVGGPVALVDDLLRHPELGARSRRVEPDQDATPPGHRAI